jgi:hypothetical protein
MLAAGCTFNHYPQQPRNHVSLNYKYHWNSDVNEIASFYRSDDNAMLVAPFPRLGDKIAVEAWTYLSTCTQFDDKGFTKFRDALRYHGPEPYPKSLLQPGQ